MPDLLPDWARPTQARSVYSGDPAMDCFVGRVAFGSTVHLVSEPRAGKTLISLLYLNQILHHPRNRDRAVLLLDLENAINLRFLKLIMPDCLDRVALLQGIRPTCQNIGQLLTSIRFNIDASGKCQPDPAGAYPGLASGRVAGVLLDSVDFLLSERDYELFLQEGVETSHSAGATAAAIATIFRLVRPLLVLHEATLFYTNHRLQKVNLAMPNVRIDRIYGGDRVVYASTLQLTGRTIGSDLKLKAPGRSGEGLSEADELEAYYRARLDPAMRDLGDESSELTTGYRAQWRVTRGKSNFGLSGGQGWHCWIDLVRGPRFQLAFSYVTALNRLAQLGYTFHPIVHYGSGTAIVLPAGPLRELSGPVSQVRGLKLLPQDPDRGWGPVDQPALLISGAQSNALKLVRMDQLLELCPEYRAFLAQWYYQLLDSARRLEEQRQVLTNLQGLWNPDLDLPEFGQPDSAVTAERSPAHVSHEPTANAGPTDMAPVPGSCPAASDPAPGSAEPPVPAEPSLSGSAVGWRNSPMGPELQPGPDGSEMDSTDLFPDPTDMLGAEPGFDSTEEAVQFLAELAEQLAEETGEPIE